MREQHLNGVLPALHKAPAEQPRGAPPILRWSARLNEFTKLSVYTSHVCAGIRMPPVTDPREAGTSRRPQSRSPDGTLGKALARAWRWQRMLDKGVYSSVSEIGDSEDISKSYVSRILRLALLAPDIVEALLAGSADESLMLERLERPLPADWKEQRHLIRLRV